MREAIILNKNIPAIGIVCLFIISSVTPMVIGYRVETNDNTDLERMLDNLHLLSTTPGGFNEQKYNYYKEQLQPKYSSESSNDDLVIVPEHEESEISEVSPQAIIAGGPMDSPWPMYSHDLHHTSRSPYSTADTTSLEKWRFRCDWVEGGPVIDSDGTIYLGSFDYYLYALYPDGTLKWKYKTGELIWSTPAITEDGTIYVSCWDTKLYAINPNGTLKWKIGTGGSIHSSPAIADDGTVYVGNFGNKIVAINPNGTIKWNYNTGDAITSDPAIGDDGTIYIGSMDNYLYAMYPNGTLRWRFGTSGEIKGPPSIADDGTIYFGSHDGYLYAVFPNGTMKWKCGVGYGTATNPSIASDGTIYVGGNNLYAVYPNGTMRWSFDMGGNRHIDASSPAISNDGTIYVGTNIGNIEGGEIIAVNPDGTERWRKKIADEWVESSPCIAEDGTVYIGSSSTKRIGPGNKWDSVGYLHAFGPVESNEPPGTPTITGPTSGRVGMEYDHWFKAIDPDRNPIRLYIEWGDGTNTGWIEEAASGEEVVIEHTWSEKGNYIIRCKAKDVMDEESDWATFEVKIERKSREVQQMLFYRLLEQFPILQKMLLFQR